MNDASPERSDTVAMPVARFLERRGVRRLFGLQGGHIQPIWDHAARLGIEIVDVRDEGAAVHMAHAHAELTDTLGVAMVTAGPGVTNTVTAIANASVARVPLLLVGGCPPRPQDDMGPLQGIPHVEIMRPITRHAVTARVAHQVLRELDGAVARAFGDCGEPGPVYVELPTDVLRERVREIPVLPEHLRAKVPRNVHPDLLWSAKRPLVITGRGARGAREPLVRLLDALGAAYLDTQESRGIVPAEHPAQAGAMRGRAMAEADVVLLVGRKLDYQLCYGSPVAFPNARFVRIAETAAELIDNRRGEVELLATPRQALGAMVATAGARAFEPARTIVVADGGDIMSFARLGLSGCMYLDCGAFGCLGDGVPYAIAAKLAFPSFDVVAVVGDGSFGFHAMEIDTAVRHGAHILIVIANNAAWNIERHDQAVNYEGRVVGTTLRYSDYGGVARSLGAYGERVTSPDELGPALQRAAQNVPAVLDVVVTRDAVSSDAQKGLAVVPDYQALVDWNALEERRRATSAPPMGSNAGS